MSSKINSLLVALSVFVGGCATTVLSSGKTTAFERAVSSVNIVFVESDLVGKSGTVGGSTANLANQHRQDIGVQISQHMPTVFLASGIPASAKSLAPSSIPTDAAGYRALFPGTPSTAVLLINPISAVTTCPGSCFQYRMQAKLVSTSSGKILWTATIDLPPKASRFHDFSGVATEFSRAVLSRLQSDGVLGSP
jgi:hypothetical protein